MMEACAAESGSSNMPHAAPIVFVVDDDVSVRESLEPLKLSVESCTFG